MDSDTLFDPGSFRDPAGRIVVQGDKILRAVASANADVALRVHSEPFFATRMGKSIVNTTVVEGSKELKNKLGSDYTLFFEHEKVDPITYPFEWPFALLKRAAVLHLELHIEAVENGYDLSDSSAYNVQFSGTKPVFIDTLSYHLYKEGSYWSGYKQFCEQFLGPLLLTAQLGLLYNDWYKGSINGLPLPAVASLLPLRSRLSLQTQMHVFMHAKMLGKVQSHQGTREISARKLPLRSLKGILQGMLMFVRSLKPKGLNNTYWKQYEFANSYSVDDVVLKRTAVAEFVAARRPKSVLDIGCNSGDFSELCLRSGVNSVVGIDFDLGALEAAVTRADEKSLKLLPLYLDLTNPNSASGWASEERKSFVDRVQADAIVALAVLHHLIIGKNIPMDSAVNWFVSRAPCGILEFVPKQDPMLQGMLTHRTDIFPNYTEEAFRHALASKARITKEVQSSASGRRIFVYERSNYA